MNHLGLNLVFMVPDKTGGMEVVARALIPALQHAAPGLKITAFVNRETANEDLGVDQVVVPVDATNRVQWVRGEQQLLPGLARKAGVDLLHSLGSTAPIHGRFKRVVTIHDLNYLVVPEAHFGVLALGMRVLIPAAAHRSDRVIAISQQTKRDLVKRLRVKATKIDVVPNGVGRPSDTPPTDEATLRHQLGLSDRPVLLALSAKRPHKNLTGLLDALAKLQDRPVLVLPGYPTPHEAELRERARTLGLDHDVRFLGWTSEADVEGLFKLATAFVFPSFYEGFGLPVLEAMARGVPVACSDRGSLKEVAGDAALLFDPADPQAIADAIRRLLTEDTADLVQKGRERVTHFTWAQTAEQTLASYERA